MQAHYGTRLEEGLHLFEDYYYSHNYGQIAVVTLMTTIAVAEIIAVVLVEIVMIASFSLLCRNLIKVSVMGQGVQTGRCGAQACINDADTGLQPWHLEFGNASVSLSLYIYIYINTYIYIHTWRQRERENNNMHV